MLRYFFFLILLTTKLFAQLNSVYDEQAPVLTPDGTELYFTVANHPMNVSGESDLGDIWVSRWEDNKWSAPTRAKGLINNAAYNAVLGFSSDGQKMFLCGHYTFDGEVAGSHGISVSRRTGAGWTSPRNEMIPNFQNSTFKGGHITPDKKVFIFSAAMIGSHDNEDIFVSFNVGTQWTEPKNLGAIINTDSQEQTPWLSADTKTLYFASNTPSSLGSFDIFSSERLDSTWTNWSPPKNLGALINSAGSELFYHTFVKKKFYTSTFESDGYGDIREVRVPVEVQPQPEQKKDSIIKSSLVAKNIVSTTLPDNGLTKIFGRVTNSETGAVVEANIVFFGPSVVFVLSSATGNYEAELLPKSRYSVRVESPGYIGFFDKIELLNPQLRQAEINFKLLPVVVGTSVNLRSVLFSQSTSELLLESYDELDMVAEFLKLNTTVEIELAGHTDNEGSAKLNLKLSRDRAKRVKNYLTEKGIAARRIKGVGYGATKPIASTRTEEGKKLNRRVEFKILKK
jgi:outer membrane protein OmpA-like peptidoglycan-associated protein